MKTKNLLILLLMVLAGCSSKPAVQASYYLLYTPVEAQQTSSSPDSQVILLKPVRLSDYLRQDSLTMQVDAHQLYVSRQHLWAEKLQHGITRALLSDINGELTEQLLISSNSPAAKDTTATLTVEFDHFVPTNQSEVIASGRYWIVKENTKPVMKSFVFTDTLKEDGYGHAVEQLRGLVGQLSRQISEDIK